MEDEPALELEVTAADAGARLDVLLVGRVEGMSRAEARRLAARGAVRVNGRRARKGRTLAAGDRVSLDELPRRADAPALPDPSLGVHVLYEDAHVVVVDKPAGVPSHPLRPDEVGTVAGALLARYPEMARVGYARREPGILHRLDIETSGVLLAARDASSFEALRALLRRGGIDKRYDALCAGVPAAPATLEGTLAPVRGDPRRVRVLREGAPGGAGGRVACTQVLRVQVAGGCGRVALRADRAWRHQIRAQLAAAGHPLLGDSLYGGPAAAGLSRQALHARTLAFEHPVTGRPLVVEAPWPADMREAWLALGGGA